MRFIKRLNDAADLWATHSGRIDSIYDLLWKGEGAGKTKGEAACSGNYCASRDKNHTGYC